MAIPMSDTHFAYDMNTIKSVNDCEDLLNESLRLGNYLLVISSTVAVVDGEKMPGTSMTYDEAQFYKGYLTAKLIDFENKDTIKRFPGMEVLLVEDYPVLTDNNHYIEGYISYLKEIGVFNARKKVASNNEFFKKASAQGMKNAVAKFYQAKKAGEVL